MINVFLPSGESPSELFKVLAIHGIDFKMTNNINNPINEPVDQLHVISTSEEPPAARASMVRSASPPQSNSGVKLRDKFSAILHGEIFNELFPYLSSLEMDTNEVITDINRIGEIKVEKKEGTKSHSDTASNSSHRKGNTSDHRKRKESVVRSQGGESSELNTDGSADDSILKIFIENKKGTRKGKFRISERLKNRMAVDSKEQSLEPDRNLSVDDKKSKKQKKNQIFFDDKKIGKRKLVNAHSDKTSISSLEHLKTSSRRKKQIAPSQRIQYDSDTDDSDDSDESDYAVDVSKRKKNKIRKHSFQCDICFKVLSDPYNLKEHKTLHTNEKLFDCDVCQKSFSTLKKLNSHKLIHNEEKAIECDVCHKIFKCRSWYERHKLTHTGEKPFECDVCHKKFNSLGNCVKHKRMHTDERPFECDICKKGFRSTRDLKVHKLLHTGEQPFECEICHRRFRNDCNYKVHKRIHTGEKPFECDVCKKRFRSSSTFNLHKLTHT